MGKESVMEEATQQIEEKKRNLETIKALMRSRYEDEIKKIKKMHDAKLKKMAKEIQSANEKRARDKLKHEEKVSERVAICKGEFAKQIKMKEEQIRERMKVITMRYDLKMAELVRANEEKLKIERTQFKVGQNLLKTEIESVTAKFKKEMQIVKRCR